LSYFKLAILESKKDVIIRNVVTWKRVN